MSALRGRVLVVDDDPDTREAVRDVLREEGYLVRLAPNGDSALQALRDAGFEPAPHREYWDSPRAFVRCPAGHRVELMAFAPA